MLKRYRNTFFMLLCFLTLLSPSLPINAQDGGSIFPNLEIISPANISRVENILTIRSQTRPLEDVAITNNEQGEYTVAGVSRSIYIWAISDDIESFTLESRRRPSRVVIFSHSKQVLVALNGAEFGDFPFIETWDLRTKQRLLYATVSMSERILTFDVSIDGEEIALGMQSGRVCLRDIDTFRRRLCVEPDTTDRGTLMHVSYGSSYVAASYNLAGIRIWDIETGELHPNSWRYSLNNLVALSPNDHFMVFTDNSAETYFSDVMTMETSSATISPSDMVFSPDGRLLILGDYLGGVAVYNGETFESLTYLETEGTVRSVSISPDGRIIISSDEDGNIILWGVPQESTP